MTSPALDDAAHRPCVLLVEDDAAVRRALQLLLRSRGIDVRAYASAPPALADAKASPACLITDFLLPEIDGLALLQEMRRRRWTGPAVLISGHLTPQLSARAEEAGFDAVLSKPLPDSLLVETVLSLVANADGADQKPSKPVSS